MSIPTPEQLVVPISTALIKSIHDQGGGLALPDSELMQKKPADIGFISAQDWMKILAKIQYIIFHDHLYGHFYHKYLIDQKFAEKTFPLPLHKISSKWAANVADALGGAGAGEV
jgi:hypothetical protein